MKSTSCDTRREGSFWDVQIIVQFIVFIDSVESQGVHILDIWYDIGTCFCSNWGLMLPFLSLNIGGDWIDGNDSGLFRRKYISLKTSVQFHCDDKEWRWRHALLGLLIHNELQRNIFKHQLNQTKDFWIKILQNKNAPSAFLTFVEILTNERKILLMLNKLIPYHRTCELLCHIILTWFISKIP